MEIIIPQERHALTIEQRRNALKYLTETRDAVKRHVTNLTEAQWNFKPSEQRWSILDVLEHLVIFETYTHHVISSMKDLPPTSQIMIPRKSNSSSLGRFRIDRRSCSRLYQDIPQVAGTPLRQ